MVRATLISLLVLVAIGCSSNQTTKSADPAPAQPGAPVSGPVSTAKEAAPPAPATGATESKPQKQPAAKAKAESGSPMDQFAKCLADKDATMYGVFWCDHCRDQEEKFGDSFKYVKYVECVTKDAPRTLIPECKAQGIKHTPTWIFADGARVEGVLGLDQLAMKTHCKMP